MRFSQSRAARPSRLFFALLLLSLIQGCGSCGGDPDPPQGDMTSAKDMASDMKAPDDMKVADMKPDSGAPDMKDEPVEAVCDDSLDNDGDGLFDCDDPDCTGASCSSTRAAWCVNSQCAGGEVRQECGNAIDDDRDGRLDCDDEDCRFSCECRDCSEMCGNGLDDDEDGIIDDGCPCLYRNLDAGVCVNGVVDLAQSCVAPAEYQSDETLCDGLDNDCDGSVDEGCRCRYLDSANGVCPFTQRGVDGSCLEPVRYQTAETACDGYDNNCDGDTDEGCELCDYSGRSTGVCVYGVVGDTTQECLPPSSYVSDEADCATDPEGGDGVDNDCDGIIDEGCNCAFQGLEVGVCALGQLDVSGDCAAPLDPFTYQDDETLCDGRDNDCDGEKDEGCQQCSYRGLDAGVCAFGRPGADASDCGAPTGFELSEVACDGLDNDCDGVVDEGCPCSYEGRARAGVCVSALIDSFDGRCLKPDFFSTVEATCDGRDNDCDGVVDEECGCDYNDLSEGVCQGQTVLATSGRCSIPTDYQSDETTCDGLDNDCDGVIDEGCPCNFDGKSAGVCVGSVRDALGVCQQPAGYEANEVDCGDGVDNDCDGSTDLMDVGCDACANGGLPTEICGNGEDDDCNGFNDDGCLCEILDPVTGMPLTAGVCKFAVREEGSNDCVAAGYDAAGEICGDGLDNDCDGAVDELCPCEFNGLSAGVCAGVLTDAFGACVSPAGYVMSEDTTYCDGLDNDCDGVVDEGCVCSHPSGSADGVCASATIDATSGDCAAPQYAPVNVGAPGLCDDGIAGAGDGQDNDCDGVTDEGCECDYNGSSVGVCGNGFIDSMTGMCVAPGYTGDEITLCDGQDNDCDGIVDEGCLCNFGSGLGVCSQGILSGVMSGLCDPPMNYDVTDRCDDALDNDCDGVVNEGCACIYNGTPLGVCATATLDTNGTCQEPTSYVSFEDTTYCDGVDNDCDGVVDEGCNCDYQGDPDGVCAGSTIDVASGVCLAPTAYEVNELECDAQDNDCDGIIDEHCPCDYLGNPTGVCLGSLVSEMTGTCKVPLEYNTNEICGDGLDNNCDGSVDEGCPCDFDNKPFGVCGTATLDAGGGCQQPAGYEMGETSCGDGVDNDCDGLVDALDPSCDVMAMCDSNEVDCSDSIDNDCDGRIDYLDDECVSCPGTGMFEFDCGNGVDDDCDGDIDQADTDCGTNFGEAGSCADGMDNDGDGFIDCDDTECDGVGSCGHVVFLFTEDTNNDPSTIAGRFPTGGLSMGDYYCSQFAAENGMNGSFKGVVFAPGIEPNKRIKINGPVFNNNNMGRQQIAADFNEFFTAPTNTFYYGANGASLSGTFAKIWTGFASTTMAGQSCDNWTRGDAFAQGDYGIVHKSTLPSGGDHMKDGDSACNNNGFTIMCISGQAVEDCHDTYGDNDFDGAPAYLDPDCGVRREEVFRELNCSDGLNDDFDDKIDCDDDDCKMDPSCGQFMFMTKTSYDGDLQGLSDADQICSDAAKVSMGLHGSFKAVLMADEDGEYRDLAGFEARGPIFNNDLASGRQEVATHAEFFKTGTQGTYPGARFTYDSDGNALSGSVRYWTGIDASGGSSAPASQMCMGWTSNDSSHKAYTGVLTSTADFSSLAVVWDSEQDCDTTQRILCISGQDSQMGGGGTGSEASCADYTDDDGDGKIDCDDDDCFYTPECTPHIFVTDGRYEPSNDFTDLSSADTICQNAAMVSSVPALEKAASAGRVVAVLSDSTNGAKSRIDALISQRPGGATRAVFRTNNAESVVSEVDHLFDGTTLENAIIYDENETKITSNYEVWTGTLSDGDAASEHCMDWNPFIGMGESARVGLSSETDGTWLDHSVKSCDLTMSQAQSYRFYCFAAP